MTTELLGKLKTAKIAVQLAMEHCEFKSEIGARLNQVWEELNTLVESVERGDL